MSLEGRLEYYNIGGDPKELMAYMVKSEAASNKCLTSADGVDPGLLPGIASLTNGDIGSKRKMTADMLDGFFRSVYSPNPETKEAFAADAIISNPPAFAHVHIAEGLGLPLLMSFSAP